MAEKTTSPTTNNNNNTTPTQPKPAVSSRRRSTQDQEIANLSSGTRQLVNTVKSDGAVRARLGPKGYDTQRLDDALGLCTTLDAKWDSRQGAIARQKARSDEFQIKYDIAKKALSDFRETARVAIKEEASLTGLGVSSEVPGDFRQFLTHARGAYANAKSPEYNPALAGYGYTVAALDAEIAALAALSTADEEHSKAAAEAQQCTRARDDAAVRVREFRTNILKIARRAFRTEPEQASKLDF